MIDRMAAGGDGIARYEGRAVFVPGGLPGDRMRVRLLPARGGRLEGRVLELLEPSPARVAPPCPYAGRCGGCAWLALDLAAQRRCRVDLVRDALARIGRLEAPAEIPVVAVDPPWVPPGLGYRARIEVALGPAGPRGRRAVGFRAAGSHEVVDVERCAVARPPVAAAFERLRAVAAAGGVPPPIVEVEIAAGDDAAHVVATARLGRAVSSGEAARLADRLVAAWPGLAGLRLEPPAGAAAPAVERGRASLTVTVPGPGGRPLPLEVPAGVFMQANPAVNARLVEAVAQAVAPREGMRLLDLYCGAGNFALPLAAAGAEVLGFETDGRAVEAARRTAARLGISTAAFRQVAVEEGLSWVQAGPRPDAVVLDPPRAGAGAAVVDRLLAMAPARVAYVSCDPATLARDLARFAAGGYDVAALTVFDMFPQTPHVETLAVLARRP